MVPRSNGYWVRCRVCGKAYRYYIRWAREMMGPICGPCGDQEFQLRFKQYQDSRRAQLPPDE